MVAEDDDHGVLVPVALHEREQRPHRVLDRVPVGAARPLGVAEELGLRGLLRRDAAEDRSVAHLVPGDEPGDLRPRRVARDEVDLGEDRRPVARRELAPLQGEEGVLVGHRRQAEVRAAVAEVAPVVDLVVAVEGRALGPRAVVGRHDADRPPPGALEGAGEREAVVADELVVAPLAVDPDPRLHRGVRQPAEAAERRRGEERAARGEAGGLQLRVALLEHLVDLGRERGVLDRDPPVALDEHEQDVLAPQAGQQPVARGWRRSGRRRSAWRAPCDRPGRSARRAPRRPPGRRRSRTRPARRRRGGPARAAPSTAAARSAHSRWPAATRVTRSSASTGMESSARTSTAATATTRSVLAVPIASRSVSMPIPT